MDGVSAGSYARSLAFALAGFSSLSHAQVLISEVVYDAAGTDAGNVFVELYGTPGTSLDSFLLQGINGSNNLAYKDVFLAGVIPADGVFVIADDMGGGTTAVPNADLIADVDFQNGPDSIQLSDGLSVIDALGYGDFASAFFAGEGTPAPAATSGASLARILGPLDTNDNFSDFEVLLSPTPGSVPVSAVPVPAAGWLFAAGLVMLAVGARRSPLPRTG